MPRYTKLSRYPSSTGQSPTSALHVGVVGFGSSSTMIVIRIAMTPSLNASIRPVPTRSRQRRRT
jgi:hypothetical protein